MPVQRWTRQQDLAVLFLRLENKGRLTLSHPDVARLAEAMGRTVDSIWMRKGNFDSLDDSVLGSGLSNSAQLTKDIWAEYRQDPERIHAEARRAYSDILRNS